MWAVTIHQSRVHAVTLHCIHTTTRALFKQPLLDWLRSVSLAVICQFSCRMLAHVQTVNSATTFYHLRFADNQPNKVCPISSGVCHLQFAIATAICLLQPVAQM